MGWFHDVTFGFLFTFACFVYICMFCFHCITFFATTQRNCGLVAIGLVPVVSHFYSVTRLFAHKPLFLRSTFGCFKSTPQSLKFSISLQRMSCHWVNFVIAETAATFLVIVTAPKSMTRLLVRFFCLTIACPSLFVCGKTALFKGKHAFFPFHDYWPILLCNTKFPIAICRISSLF